MFEHLDAKIRNIQTTGLKFRQCDCKKISAIFYSVRTKEFVNVKINLNYLEIIIIIETRFINSCLFSLYYININLSIYEGFIILYMNKIDSLNEDIGRTKVSFFDGKTESRVVSTSY